MCMDHDTEKRVDIDRMIGYAVALKKGDTYAPVFHSSYTYKKGVRYRATYYGDRHDAEHELPVRKNSKRGGFYLFHTKYAAENLASQESKYGRMNYVVLKCVFEEVFEKGKWNDFVAYRAKFRTILEEV